MAKGNKNVMAGRNRDGLGVERTIVMLWVRQDSAGMDVYMGRPTSAYACTRTLILTGYSCDPTRTNSANRASQNSQCTPSESLLHYLRHPIVQFARGLSDSPFYNSQDVFPRNIVIAQPCRQAKRINETAVSAARSTWSGFARSVQLTL